LIALLLDKAAGLINRVNLLSFLCLGGGAQSVQPGENNNTFHHLEDISSELKLTTFSEKEPEKKQFSFNS
jgi:hypothetical protein